jgi:hypothetical protein
MPINQFAAPSGAHLEPLESSKPILTPGYELRPIFNKFGRGTIVLRRR